MPSDESHEIIALFGPGHANLALKPVFGHGLFANRGIIGTGVIVPTLIDGVDRTFGLAKRVHRVRANLVQISVIGVVRVGSDVGRGAILRGSHSPPLGLALSKGEAHGLSDQ